MGLYIFSYSTRPGETGGFCKINTSLVYITYSRPELSFYVGSVAQWRVSETLGSIPTLEIKLLDPICSAAKIGVQGHI